MIDPLQILRADKNIILYRPELNKITESAAGSILLQQILFRFTSNGDKPFYKFKQPCDHPKYKNGDSWCEELGFSRYEFDKSLSAFAQKINKKTERDPDAMVWFWTDASRLTWYEVNTSALRKAVGQLYVKSTVNFTKSRPSTLHYTETTTEITTETTTEKNKNSVELGTRPDVSDVDGESPVKMCPSSNHAYEEESAVDVQTPNNIREDEAFARDALKVMNEVIGGRYTPTPSNLKGLRARYKEAKQNGTILTVEEIKRMVEWKKHHFTVLNPNMKPYLRPKTLFNGENFEGYMQEAENWDRPKPQEPTRQAYPPSRAQLNEYMAKTGRPESDYDSYLTFEQNLNA